MGMFDSVFFKCPECGEKIEEQSKAGKCNLIEYDQSDVDPVVAADLSGERVTCECGEEFVISSNIPKSIELRLAKRPKTMWDDGYNGWDGTD